VLLSLSFSLQRCSDAPLARPGVDSARPGPGQAHPSSVASNSVMGSMGGSASTHGWSGIEPMALEEMYDAMGGD